MAWKNGKKKGLKCFKGFEGLQPFKVCTLRERISHVLSKNCHVLGNKTCLVKQNELIVLFAPISRLCNFQKWNFNVYFRLCTKEIS